MKYPKLIFLILLIVMIYLGTKSWQKNQVESNYDLSKKQECLSKKGQWVTWGKGWFCNDFFEDAGKVCHSGKECSSEKCSVEESSKAGSGECAGYFIVPGCFDYLSDGGKHTGFNCADHFLKVETK